MNIGRPVEKLLRILFRLNDTMLKKLTAQPQQVENLV